MQLELQLKLKLKLEVEFELDRPWIFNKRVRSRRAPS